MTFDAANRTRRCIVGAVLAGTSLTTLPAWADGNPSVRPWRVGRFATPALTLSPIAPAQAAPAPTSTPAAPAKAPAAPEPSADSADASPPPSAPADKPLPVSPVNAAERAREVEPKPAEPAPVKTRFAADPIADGGIILGGIGFAGMLELINGTGEIRPQQIAPNFQRSQLVMIDRGAISLTPDPSARVISNVGLVAVGVFAAVDPILTGVRENNVQSWLVDSVIYAESVAVTWGMTNLAKMAVRRPRPQAYIDAAKHKDDPNYSNSNTDSALSFFSGHASISAAVTATATYLAFARSGDTARPWITLGIGTAVTSVVSVERVRAGAHFPTDVIAGSIAGAGIGLIVPHLHRSEDVKRRRIWVGFAPDGNNGGAMQVGGLL